MKSIALRLWVYIIILILMILTVLWFFQAGLLSDFYVDYELESIKREAAGLSNLKDPKDLYELNDEIEDIAKTYNATVNLIDNRGTIIASSGRVMRGRVANIEALELPYVLKGQERSAKEEHTMSGMQLAYVGIPILYNGNVLGAVFIHMPLSSVEETLDILQSQFFIVTIIAVLIATLGAFILSKTFTRPILKINNAAVQISKGKFDTKVEIKYRDEIGRLGDTINHMASELSKVENLRKDLIANISHEFRTPLGIIRSYGEGLLDNVYADDSEREEYINIILSETTRLSRLVDDVLDISKLQSGNIKIESVPFNLSALVYRVHDKFKVLCHEKGVNLFLDSPEEVKALGDEARIEQVMINLLNNSLNHTHKDGDIKIKVISNENVVVEVIDTGKGIPKEDIPYVFERFYKVDKTGKKTGAGTGLGLAIVKEILKGHSSDYGVESELDKGTKVFFSLKKA